MYLQDENKIVKHFSWIQEEKVFIYQSYRVLAEVVVAASRDGVEVHEVLKVGDLPVHPLACQPGGFEQVFRRPEKQRR